MTARATIERSSRPASSRVHVLCLGGSPPLAETLRARFAHSHVVELLNERSDVTALVRTFQRASRREGDEVEVVIAEAVAEATAEADILRTHWPTARWVVVGESAPAVESVPVPVRCSGSASAEMIAAAVWAAIRDYRDQRHADVNAALARMELFRDLPASRLAWIADHVELRRYEAGEVVVRVGDPGDGVYFIRSGGVKVLDAEPGAGDRVIVRRVRGENFGEMALITGAPRSNTVVTDLDSELFFLPKDDYDDLTVSEPRLARNLSRVLSTRLAHAQRRQRDTPRIIACYHALPDAAGAGVAARALAEATAVETERAVILLQLDADSSASGNGLEGVIRRLQDSTSLSKEDCRQLAPGLWYLGAQRTDTMQQLLRPQIVPGLLHLLTEAFDFVVVAIQPRTPPELLVRVAKQCDVLLVHVGRGAGCARQTAELLALVHHECPSAESKIVVAGDPQLGPEGTDESPGALLGRPVNHPVPQATSGHLATRAYRRMARRLVGIGVGLTLGGGGARGAAHLGVIEVLEREGVPVDLISGTSVGSIIGAGYAMERTAAESLELWQRETRVNPVRRYALSRTALFSDRGMEGMLRRLYGDLRAEELPIPFAAVATDLHRATAVPIDCGPLWIAVRASCSLPGALAPVRIGDTYFVDGGVSNNVPADVVRARGARFVIAVDVSRERGFQVGADVHAHGWVGRGFRRIPGVREFLEGPSIIQVLMRAMEVQALQTVTARAQSWNVRIRPDVSDFASLEFGATDALIARGREAAMASLPEIRAGLQALVKDL